MIEGNPLPQGAGYAVVLGLGFVFAFGMMGVTTMLRRYQKEIMTAEEFATAGRSVSMSLVAVGCVSSWTWAATLLTSTAQSYKNGISGGFWYGAGASVQVMLFAAVAIRARKIAPESHTFLEIIRARYGQLAGNIFTFYALAINILVSAMLLTGASATINFLTGMNTIACLFLLPIGVVLYILYGGVKSVFITDYIHTVIMIVILFIFAFQVYATNPLLGSPGFVWEKLMELGKTDPVEGNHDGSYLTFHSHNGGLFLIINICGNFPAVFLDSGYFQKSVAASTRAILPGYVLGGLAWVAIPVLISTSLGLGCRVLETMPEFIYYPNSLTSDQVSAGLVVPAAAYTLLGKGGAVATLLIVFMAFTSAMSAEIVAVSSIFTFDIYKGQINPNASGKKLMITNYISVIAFTLAMVGFGIGLYESGVSLGFLYNFMGVIIAPAVLPFTLTLFWKDQNVIAATVSPMIGSILAIIGWLAAAKGLYGSVSYDNLFEDDVMMTGNLIALCSPGIFIPIFTYIFKPQNYNFETMKDKIHRIDETEEILQSENLSIDDINQGEEEIKLNPITSAITISKKLNYDISKSTILQEESEYLNKASKLANWGCLFFFLVFIVVWPMPMFGSNYIFSKKFFTGWVVVWIIWLFFTAGIVILSPLWESRRGIYTTLRGIYWDLSGQSYKLKEWQESNPEQLHVVQSQISAVIHGRNGNEDTIINNIDEKLESD
ncbi:hypothetical protein WICMUC_003071 [Wickerhamomyces mucosus]|uniref:Urea active transporter n=1 Tax=Wickerhamomyces mucosus TaxID=1378264 RepID=A0A9P8PMS1_9ASCO|nr:hypothetical protein WICMUC_003071 [Wickerhamomyces mucosus]